VWDPALYEQSFRGRHGQRKKKRRLVPGGTNKLDGTVFAAIGRGRWQSKKLVAHQYWGIRRGRLKQNLPEHMKKPVRGGKPFSPVPVEGGAFQWEREGKKGVVPKGSRCKNPKQIPPKKGNKVPGKSCTKTGRQACLKFQKALVVKKSRKLETSLQRRGRIFRKK